jgi:hypothetical protein
VSAVGESLLPRRRWTPSVALPLLLYAALAVAFLSRAWFASPVGLVDGSGDPQQSVWFLSWVPWAIGHGVNPFITHHINTPDGVNLMWNALAPLLGIALWPITATAGPVVAYDVLVTAELALSAWCAFLLIRRYVPRTAAAVAGGALYGFSPFLATQAPGHSKVAFALLPPLLLLIIDDVVVRLRSARRGGLLLGVLLGAQLLVYEEGFVLALVAGAVVLLVLAVRAGWAETQRRAGHVAKALAWSVPPLALIAAVPIGYQLFGPDRLPSLVPGGAVYVTDVANLVVPNATQWFSPSWAQSIVSRFSGNTVENAAYLGVPLLLVMLVVLLRSRRRELVIVCVASGVLLVLLSMGPNLHVGGHTSRIPLPWKVISVLPLLGSALPSRLFVYVDLFAAVLFAVFVDEVLLAPAARAAWRGAAAVAVALVALSVLPSRAGFAQLEVPDFFNSSFDAVVPDGSTVLVAPYAHDGTTALPMLWQAGADMAFRMPEGYFVNVDRNGARRDGPVPTSTSEVMAAIQSGREVAVSDVVGSRIRADLGHWKVSAVIVGPMPYRERMIALFAQVLGAAPLHRGGVDVWSDLTLR